MDVKNPLILFRSQLLNLSGQQVPKPIKAIAAIQDRARILTKETIEMKEWRYEESNALLALIRVLRS